MSKKTTKKKPRTTLAWGGFIEGRLDAGWRLGIREDISPLVSVFTTREYARRFFQDVRRVEIREVVAKAEGRR